MYQEFGCIYSFLCSPLQACGGFACCCSFILSPSKTTGQNPSILSEIKQTSHVWCGTNPGNRSSRFILQQAAFWLPAHQSNPSPWAVHPSSCRVELQFNLLWLPSRERIWAWKMLLDPPRGEQERSHPPGSHSEDTLRIKSMLLVLHLLPVHKNCWEWLCFTQWLTLTFLLTEKSISGSEHPLWLRNWATVKLKLHPAHRTGGTWRFLDCRKKSGLQIK